MSDIKEAAAILAQFGVVAKVLDDLGALDEARGKFEARVEELKNDEARIRDSIAEMRNKSVEDNRRARDERAAADAELARRRDAVDSYGKQQRAASNDELIKARSEAAKIQSEARDSAAKIIADARAEAAQYVETLSERRRAIADLDRQIRDLKATQADLRAKLGSAAA